ncbi:hypothetical protein DFH07DRAFT_801428 [Mycena maculata]|uniref:Uncharacterized protein n=1 Tax=Mycena maculata TaxID=230809 RepID=A0AAD7K1C2_9AGAR|nr:hypothetical protein DFH07DRAFT_801428 [Mycena maculata]
MNPNGCRISFEELERIDDRIRQLSAQRNRLQGYVDSPKAIISHPRPLPPDLVRDFRCLPSYGPKCSHERTGSAIDIGPDLQLMEEHCALHPETVVNLARPRWFRIGKDASEVGCHRPMASALWVMSTFPLNGSRGTWSHEWWTPDPEFDPTDCH